MTHGAIATTHPQAVDAGATVMASGGNAVDAAVAAAATLCVVEPMSVSLGGDLFALVWEPEARGPVGLVAAGWAGSASGGVPLAGGRLDGAAAVTVPGAIAGWRKLLDRSGSMDEQQVLAPAIAAAHEGFAVTPTIATMWAEGSPRLKGKAREVFLTEGGGAPRAGAMFRNPLLGGFLERLATDGLERFYSEEGARSIVGALGGDGLLTAADILEWPGAEWVQPLSRKAWGYDVYEMPTPGQGLSVLEALSIYASLEVPPEDRQHAAIESVKVALEDAAAYVCDPRFGPDAAEIMLDPQHLETRAGEISLRKARPTSPPEGSDTVFVAAVDDNGLVCALIQSIYMQFGSGVMVPDMGVLLHNRGANFRLDPRHPNRLEPRKRPLHTILPAMVGLDGRFYAALGVVGAFMQPQGQTQILRSVLEEGAAPAAALDEPRWRIWGGTRLGVEDGFDAVALESLERKGHSLEPLRQLHAGGAQLIVRHDDGIVGASEPRRDGYVRRV